MISVVMYIRSSQKTVSHHCSHRDKWCHPLDKLLKLKTLFKEILPKKEVTFSTPTTSSDNVQAAPTARNLCEHLLDLNMDILHNRNITSKHLGLKGLHLNETGSSRLAENIVFKLHKFWWSLEHLNESPAKVSINISWPPINCES